MFAKKYISHKIIVGRRSSAGESRPSRWNVQKTEGLEDWLKRRCQIYLNRRFSIKILMLRSNTAHLQSEDKSAEPPQEQRSRRMGTKKERNSRFSPRTQSRGRTGTGVDLLVFETSASTDSAIWAWFDYQIGGQRYKNFYITTIFIEKYSIFLV